jgi:UDP-N-acetylglucosamine--N-acetylmuramyl-(pentapeptide) pyrophosphoryl-undecaprenol N-acetylglucosamine transferase
MIESLDFFLPRQDELFFTHQTGERDYNAVRIAYARRGMGAEVRPFFDDMPERFGQSDLIISRSGAITVAEIAAAGRASILVPFPKATDQHQLRNAQAMAKAKAARLLPQDELTPERLASEILALVDAPQELRQMEQAARHLARPRATQDIVEMLERIART